METWLGGGYGRAQGGYDEMMFRAMVRDGARFYDPLGLVSKGTEVDFQVGANAYLYGTRFMSYLALEYGPEKLLDWWRRDAGSRRSYSDDFRARVRPAARRGLAELDRFEHEFQAKNLAAVREHPVTPHRNVTRTGLGRAVPRVLVSDDRQTLYAAVRYPGRVPHLVAISLEDGSVKELAEVTGAVQYRVPRWPSTRRPARSSTPPTTSTYRNLLAYDLKTGKSKMLLKEQRIGDLAFNRADRSLWGLRTNNGFVILVRIPYPYTEWQTVHVFPYGEVAFDLDVSPDGSLVSTSMAGLDSSRAGAQVMQVRVMKTEALLAGDATPIRTLEFGSSVPEGFVFSPDGRYLYGSSYYTGCFEHLPLRDRDREDRGGQQRRDRLLPPGADLGRRAAGVQLHRRWLRPGDDPAATDRGPERDHVPRRAHRDPASGRAGLERRIAGSIRLRIGRSSGRAPTSRHGSSSLESHLPDRRGLQGLEALGVHARFSDPIGFSTAERHGAATDPTASCRRRSAQARASASSTSSGRPVSTGMPAISTTSSGRPSAAARATTPSWPTTVRSSTGRRRP